MFYSPTKIRSYRTGWSKKWKHMNKRNIFCMFIESKIFRVGRADRVGDVLKVQNLIMRTFDSDINRNKIYKGKSTYLVLCLLWAFYSTRWRVSVVLPVASFRFSFVAITFLFSWKNFSVLLSRVGAHVKNAAITSGKTLYQTSPIFNFYAKTLILITVLFQLGNGNAFVFITALEVKSLHSEFFHLPK